MSEELAISLRGVSKCFKRYERPVDRLKELLIPGKSRAQEFWALRDIDLDVPKGQTLGIVGRNGSGKSTLLQIIAGTLTPTTGTVQVNGRVSALLELGSGFNPEFTGRQNVFFNGQLLGLTKGEVEERFDDIAAFADIGDFIDQPVKTYSSGMFVRLAFAVASHSDSDILIIDEALSVGDMFFQNKCMRLIKNLLKNDLTLLFVSHDINSIKAICDQSILLKDHHIEMMGSSGDVADRYSSSEILNLEKPGSDLNSNTSVDYEIALETKNILHDKSTLMNLQRKGTGQARITACSLTKKNSKKSEVIFEFDDSLNLEFTVQVLNDLDELVIAFYIRDKNLIEVIGSNNCYSGSRIFNLVSGDIIHISFIFTNYLRQGDYSIAALLADSDIPNSYFDWVECCYMFQCLNIPGRPIWSQVLIPINVTITKDEVYATRNQ